MKHYLMVEAHPSHPDRVDEFNEWYETTHIREVVALDGFLNATRLAPADESGGSYVTLYEIEGDPKEALHNVHAAAAAKQFDMSDSLSFGPVPKMRIMQVYSEYVKPQ
ncbi:hypothetical protein [Rhodococcus artemisiae]|uniref:DUF4286 family protein n=1 Tax=Rhodococcus artemisiae TaxID=714159 RepID=A0ABU7L5L8_9NOCA|nr:hypothetical protein [Rhodococcus artemisiae]MEE2056855.1 hypothetical protein [Rhodococcus artemisiae]